MDKKHTIGNVTALFMLLTAAALDGVQALLNMTVFLLPVSIFLTFCSFIIFFLWFALSGVKYNQNTAIKLLYLIGSTVAELAPIINTLPALSAGVIGMIVQTRLEDMRRDMGGKITPRTAQAMVRKMHMDQMRQQREAAAREGRMATEETRHGDSDASDSE